MRRKSNLGDYLHKAEITAEQLAREINRRNGVGTVGVKAPYGWIKGSFPRGRVPIVVAEILSERLATSIEVDQIWPWQVPPVTDDHDLIAQPLIPWDDEVGGHRASTQFGREAEAGLMLPSPRSTTDLVSAAVDWLTAEPGEFQAQSVGEDVNDEAVEALNRRVAELRQFDDAQGGRMVARWTVHDLRWTLRLASAGSYDAAVGKGLHSVLAELAQLAGWLLIDLGYRGEGQQYLLAALREAARLGDRALGAYVLSCLGYDLMWHGESRDALRMLGIARTGAREGAKGAVGALLATRMARAHAHLGEDSKCRTALQEAFELVDAPAATPDWCSWVTPAVLEADAGRAYLDLGNAGRAEEQLSVALRSLDPGQRRNRLLHHTSVAQARLALGQVDGAAQAVHSALKLTRSVESRRARYRLRNLVERFAKYDAVSAREARDGIRQFLVRGPLSA